MAHSLEVRTPLVDVPLWEKVTRLVLGGYAWSESRTWRLLLLSRFRLPSSDAPRPDSILVREWLLSGDRQSEQDYARGLRGWASLLYRRVGLAKYIAA